MIDVYIRFYKDQNSGSKTEPIAAEKKILTLPTTMQLNGLPIQSPKVKVEMGKSESFDFTLPKNSPYYQGVFQNKTIFRVVYDGNTIFYGRAITIDTNWKNGNQTVHCEGPLSFLIDTYYKAVKETKRKKISLNTYITDLLSNHRWYVGDSSRDIWPGEIPGGYSNAIESDQQISDVSEKFGVSSWTETKSALEDVRGYYGGYFRTRYSGENSAGYGYVYLDWLKDYFRDMTGANVQKIEVAKNLIDYSARTEISNLFTAIVPVGKDGLTLGGYNGSNLSTETWRDVNHDSNGTADWIAVPAVYEMYHDALNKGYHNAEDYRTALDIYGWVYKTVSFPDAGTKSKLFTEAIDWLKNNYYPFVDTYTIKAIDMRMLGKADDAILVGDKRVFSYISSDGASGSATRPMTLTVISAEYDLYNLENTSYKVGIPSELLTKMWNVKSGTKTTGNSTDPKGNPGDNEQTASEEYDDWMSRIVQFLMFHDVPGSDTKYYIPGDFGMFGQLYNSLTGQWEYLDDHDGLTYDEVFSRGLTSWISLHDEPEDAAEWKRILHGYNDDGKTPYLDMLKEIFMTTDVPNTSTKILYESETNPGQYYLYVPATERWGLISDFTLKAVSNLGLFDWYYNVFGVDLRDESAVYTVTETEIDPETGNPKTKTTSVFGWTYDKVDDVFKKAKLFMYNWTNNTWEFIDQLSGNSQTYVDSYSTEWVNTRDSIGQVIKRKRTDAQGNVIYDVDAAKILASVRVNPDTGVEETLADIMADTVDVRATNKITLALNNTDAAFVLTKLEGMDANQKDTLASLIASQIDVRAENKVSIGLNNTDAAFVLGKLEGMSDPQKGTLASLIADKISITANQIAQFGVAVGNEITAGMLVQKLNDGTTQTKITADAIDLDGYVTMTQANAKFLQATEFTAQNIEAKFANVDVSFGQSVNAHDLFVYDGSDASNRANVRSFIQSIAISGPDSNGQYTITGHRILGQDDVLTFRVAGSVTIEGTWSSGTFTVGPTASTTGTTNTVTTTITGYQTALSSASGKTVSITFGVEFDEDAVGETIGYIYTYPNPININAYQVYNNGWNAAEDQVSYPTVANTGSGTFTITYPTTHGTSASSPDPSAGSITYTLKENKNSVWISASGPTEGMTVALIPNTQYDKGWRAAYGQFDSPTATPATIPNNISVYYPNSQPDGTAPHRDYYLTCDNSNVYLKYGQGSDAPVVAQITNTAYDAGKSYATTNLDVVDNGNNKVDVTLDGTTVTTYSHNKYTLGQNSIKIAKSWSGGIATLTKSTASTLPTSQEIRLTSATTWNGNVATVTIWDGPADAQQGGIPTEYTITVDAGDIYSNGRSQGRDDVVINETNWSSGQKTFSKSIGSPSSRTVKLLAGLVSWSSGVGTIEIYDGDGDSSTPTGCTVIVTVPALTYGWQTLSGATNTITVSQSTTDVASVRQVLTIGVDSSESWSSGTRLVYLYSNVYGQSSQTKRARYGISIPSTGTWGTQTFSSSENAYSVPFTICGKTFTGSVPLTAAAITANGLTAVTTTTGLTNLGTVAAVIDGTTKTAKYATTISSVKGFYLTVDGTDAYAAGWNAAVSGTSMPGSYSTSTTINVRLPSTTVDGELRTRQYVIGADATYAYLQYLRSSDSQYVTVCRVTHNQYNLGWHAAYDVNGLPSAYATNSYMTVTMPGSSPGNTITRKYYVGADSNYAYIQYLRESDNQYVTVARIPNTGGGSGSTYNSGWTAAYNQITLPTTASTANSYIDVITPKSTPGSYPPATSRYTLSADTSYVYLKYGTVTVARADNTGYQSAYEAGFQEGWTRCLNPYYSYWWAGTETIDGVNWWDVCRPKTTAWRYALQGESAYQAAKQADWKNVGEYWNDACLELTGQETHSYKGSISSVEEADASDDPSATGRFYGKLYAYYNGGYHAITSSNYYWFFSTTDLRGGNVYR